MQQCVRGDQPWTQHALACLLQDMLEVTVGGSNTTQAASTTSTMDDSFEMTSNACSDMDTDAQPAGPSWGQTGKLIIVATDPIYIADFSVCRYGDV